MILGGGVDGVLVILSEEIVAVMSSRLEVEKKSNTPEVVRGLQEDFPEAEEQIQKAAKELDERRE